MLRLFFFERRKSTNSGYFITATDTGVGKTVIATGLGMILKEKGYDVGVMKPVQNGSIEKNGSVLSDDIRCLANAVGCTDDPALINPYSLKEPLAPLVAALREEIVIKREKIMHCFTTLCRKHTVMIVEGIGGLLVPLRHDYFVSDMIRDCNLPVIIVTRPTLGTINHTLLTIKHLSSIGASVVGIIINYTEDSEQGVAEETNPSVIEQLSGTRVLGIVPYISSVSDEKQENKNLTQAMEKYIDLDALMEYIA